MIGRVITTTACIDEGLDWLQRVDPRLADTLSDLPSIPVRRYPDGFEELFKIMLGQQVSVASAKALWSKLEEERMTSGVQVSDASEGDLRDLGLSKQKARYAKALAQANLDFDALRDLPTDVVVSQLTAVTGIGPWTAQIYAMFCLGRADAFASGDLALQEAARVIFKLESRPSAKELEAMSMRWSPWRAVAARVLWVYYADYKGWEGGI